MHLALALTSHLNLGELLNSVCPLLHVVNKGEKAENSESIYLVGFCED